MKLARISDPQLSPGRQLVAFRSELSIRTARKPMIFVVPARAGPARSLPDDGTQNSRPRWDARFEKGLSSCRIGAGIPIRSMYSDGADRSDYEFDRRSAEGETVSPGRELATIDESCLSPVRAPDPATPGFLIDSIVKTSETSIEEAASKMHARVYTQLLYRHWTEYKGSRRSHLLDSTDPRRPQPKDLTPGDLDVPPFSLGGPEPTSSLRTAGNFLHLKH